ncbi:MAG: alcohol dehydrogenase [Chloroflexi bacterium]|jgi:2-desacetyl-2-hydroxyethyl bacteriochlorophyllide A dehydrogenase|nr:alcohol dehydrogenase [Chloroflexota bacterium]
MKCVVCRQPNELNVKEIDRPTAGPGEALIRVRRIGICGTDFHAFRGNQPFFTYPRVLGHELAGTIEEIGPNNAGLNTGDPVAIIPYLECGKCLACRMDKVNCCTSLKVIGVHIDGGMQEFLAVPIDHLLKTGEISIDQSVILEPLSIGAHAVRRAEITPGEHVLVIGAGPIGLSVMAFAAIQGAKVSVMDVNEERLKFAREWANLHRTLNALDNPMDALSNITGGDFPTVVFDATGNPGSMMSSFNYVANGGKLVFVGLVKADISFSDPDFHRKELTLFASRNATRQDFETVKETIRTGEIDSSRYITHRTDLNHIAGRFEELFDPTARVIKAIVEV